MSPQCRFIDLIGQLADRASLDLRAASPEGRWRPYTYDEIIQRDKASLDIFWLRDESLEDFANLSDPDGLATEIIEDLQAALEELQAISDDLAQTPGAQQEGIPDD